MANIKLDENETALFNEVGTRGDAFRRAIRDRAAEQVRVTRHTSEVVDGGGDRVDAFRPGDPDPESVATADGAPPEKPAAPPAPEVTEEERREGPQALLAPRGEPAP